MNTTQNIDVLSDVLLEDERIVSTHEREFLADLLRHSENNPHKSNPEITRAIARIAGEIVVQRAGGLVGESILRKLSDQNLTSYSKPRNESLPPRPPGPTPPSPGPGMHRTLGPKGILRSDIAQCTESVPPRCVVFEEFLAPSELSELLSYTLAHQEHFVSSEVISPGVNGSSSVDFEYRRSHVLMDLGPYHEKLMHRLHATLPRVLPKLGMEPFSISRMEAQITASKDGDFFRWHSDNAQDEVAARQITFVYFFHREPKVFEGGELRIQNSSWHDKAIQGGSYYTIIPQQNQVVLFDSSLTHDITPVKCPSGKFADSRFTVNGWFSR